MQEDKLYYSVEEALRASGIGRTKFYEAIRGGLIKGVKKLGTRTLIPVDGLRAWLDNLPEIGSTVS